MEIFWKIIIVVILTVILGTVIEKTDKDISTVLSIFSCCVVAITALQYLRDVIDFLLTISKDFGDYDAIIMILFKVSGVALSAELIGHISSDAGYSSLGKAVQIFGNTAILSISLPLFETLIALIQEIIGNV